MTNLVSKYHLVRKRCIYLRIYSSYDSFNPEVVKINIRQHKISIGSQYEILVEQNEKYYAETDLFSRKIIHLYLKKDLIKRITIFKSFYFFTPDYKIELPNGNRIKFQTLSHWQTYFKCVLENDIYEVYRHRKRKISIYKNGLQIGACKKNNVTIFAGDNYELILDRDTEVELLISFLLILDNMTSKNRGNIITLDIGLIFKEFKKFDANWKPK